jgi:hypothetical protein
MRTLALVVVSLLPLGACTLLEQAKDTYNSAAGLATSARDEYVAAKAAADTNKDGRTSVPEWLSYLTLVLGGGAVAGAVHATSKRNKTQAELDQLYDEVRPPAATPSIVKV